MESQMDSPRKACGFPQRTDLRPALRVHSLPTPGAYGWKPLRAFHTAPCRVASAARFIAKIFPTLRNRPRRNSYTTRWDAGGCSCGERRNDSLLLVLCKKLFPLLWVDPGVEDGRLGEEITRVENRRHRPRPGHLVTTPVRLSATWSNHQGLTASEFEIGFQVDARDLSQVHMGLQIGVVYQIIGQPEVAVASSAWGSHLGRREPLDLRGDIFWKGVTCIQIEHPYTCAMDDNTDIVSSGKPACCRLRTFVRPIQVVVNGPGGGEPL